VVTPDFDPNELVTVDFTDATLSFILQQLLGGALGVNYIAPDALPEHINFKTETPLPKSRVLQVVRDLLGRNNLVMRFVNGVYHIGAPELIDALQANAAAGRPGDDITRIIDLPKGNTAEVVALASQLLPQNVSVMATSSSDKVVVKANPNDMDSIQTMLRSLSELAVGSDKVAIIPLRRSAPDAVAAQLNQYYASSLGESGAKVTIVPLQNQQAILVGTSDATLMDGLQILAQQLDRSVTDTSELRIIALTHRKAVDIVPQLTQLFGSTAVASVQPAADSGSEPRMSTGVMSRLFSPQGAAPVSDNEDGTGLAVPISGAAPVAASDSGNAANGAQSGPFPASTATAPVAGETRIVADESTNSILVYSTYSVYKRMKETVLTLDVAQAQVVIEATVLEVDLNDALETGVQFFLQSHGVVLGSGIPSGNQSPSRGGVFGVSTNIGDVSVDLVLKALREVTNLKVVSSPYLTVVDGQAARLVIGDQIPFATSTQTSSNSGNVTVTQQVEILDTGVVLEITPRIYANNSVNLTIVQSVSTPSGTGGTTLTPVVATRDISSQILAQSGRTILLGGMIQDRLENAEEGVPGASDIPLIGGLFRQNKTSARRTELIVLITPRVVRSSSEIEGITRLLQGVQGGQTYSQDLKDY
jgi:general secretion pathway protein D